MKLSEFQEPPKKLSDFSESEPLKPFESKATRAFGELVTGEQRKKGVAEIDGKQVTTGEMDEFDLPFELSKRQAKTALGLLTTFNPQAKINILKENYPDLKFLVDSENNILVDGRPYGGEVGVLDMPGVSPRDLLQAGFQVALFTPAAKAGQIAGGVAKTAGLGAGAQTATKIAAGATAAGATEIARGELSESVGGEPATRGEVITSAALGGLGEAIQPVGQAIKETRQASQLRTEKGAIREVQKEFIKGQKAQQKTGVGLFPAQKTLDPFALEEQSFLGSLPAAARKARTALQQQNREVGRAVDDLLDQISPLRSSADEDIRGISEQIITNAKLARTRQTSPAFKAAFTEKKIIPVDEVLGNIDEELKKYGKGRIQSLLIRVRNQIEDAANPVEGSNLERLHNTKRSIWSEIERYEAGGKALDAEIKRKLTDTYGDIVSKLRGESKAYETAMEQFIAASPEVTRLQKGKIGQIAKIKDENLKSVTSRIFDAGETNPKIIKDTKKLISEVDPEAWNAIVRTEAQKRLKNIDLDVSKLTPDNAPAKIKQALFGAGNKRRVFLESLDPEQRINALYLESVLERASKGRPGGSQTGVRQIITDKIQGLSLAVRRWLKSPIERTIATGEESAFNRSAEKLAEIMYDPNWSPKLTRIRKMKEPDAAYKAMLQLLNDLPEEEL